MAAVSLVYYGGHDGPGPEELGDEVWAGMIDGERQQDPERQGVAILIEVDSVAGAGASGVFQQVREA